LTGNREGEIGEKVSRDKKPDLDGSWNVREREEMDTRLSDKGKNSGYFSFFAFRDDPCE
jgi:hypothetical protein